MNILQLSPLAIILALALSNMALANDAPAKPGDAKAGDAKAGEAAKPAGPAEKELPSKPFPKVGVLPKPVEKPADKAIEKAAEKASEKPATDQHAAGHDKPAEAAAAAQPEAPIRAKKRKPAKHAAANHGAANTHPALKDVAREAVNNNAQGQSPDLEPYVVVANDTLDRVIKKTFPTTPFSDDVMREAFIKANPQVLAEGKSQKMRPGQMLRVPDAAMFRLIVLGEVGTAAAPTLTLAAARGASDVRVMAMEPMKNKDTSVPVLAPVPSLTPNPTAVTTLAVPRQAAVVASSMNPPAQVPEDEKKKWVRYP